MTAENSADIGPSVERFEVGTLRYTRAALLTMTFWMLWADLCLQIMESLTFVVPYQLRQLGAGDTLIAFIKDSLQAMLAIFLVPLVGPQSDRHRGALGRRMPFLLYSIPPVCISLILLGFVTPIASFVHTLLAPISPSLTPAAVAIFMVAVFATIFFVANTYVVQVFNYLVADIVPQAVMGRFIGAFRAVGALGGFVFNRWIFGFVETGIAWVYTGCALMFASAFCLLVWRVREGEYPPPAPPRSTRTATFRDYFKSSFGNALFLKVYAMSLFFWCATVPFNTFILFFAVGSGVTHDVSSLGLTAEEFGQIRAWTFVPKIIVAILIGPMIDRLDVFKIATSALFVTTVLYICGFFLVRSPQSLLFWWIINELGVMVFLVSYLSLLPKVFPKDSYGQYFGANQMFFSLGLVIAPVLCGVLLQSLRDYRFIFIWSACASFLAGCFTVWLKRDWVQQPRVRVNPGSTS